MDKLSYVAGRTAKKAQQAAKVRAVERAQQHLNEAREEYENALTELAERRDLVASSVAWCAQWSEQALAEAVKRLEADDLVP